MIRSRKPLRKATRISAPTPAPENEPEPEPAPAPTILKKPLKLPTNIKHIRNRLKKGSGIMEL